MDERSKITMELQEFINNNWDRIQEKLEAGVKRNAKGQVLLSRDDEWFQEEEWDILLEEVKRRNANKDK